MRLVSSSDFNRKWMCHDEWKIFVFIAALETIETRLSRSLAHTSDPDLTGNDEKINKNALFWKFYFFREDFFVPVTSITRLARIFCNKF
jgi:hypothetical protein